MITKFTKEELAIWIAGIKECAKQDTEKQTFCFIPTINSPFSIVAGWKHMPLPDVFCISKSHPEYVMCVKIVVNDEQHCCFDSFNMPTDKNGVVDDTCIPLEWDDAPEAAAEFFMHEWERIMSEYADQI